MHLIQSNGNGFRTGFPDLYAVIQHCNPAIVCLQQMFLCPTHTLNLQEFTAHRFDHLCSDIANWVGGGAAILIKDCTVFS